MRTPTQVEILTVELDRLLESTHLSEEVRPNEQAGTGQHENVAHRIVLLLVDLVFLDRTVELSEAIRVESDHLQPTNVIPLHDLRADQARVRAVQLFDHQAHGVGIESHIVVQEQKEAAVALNQSGHRIGHRGETGVRADVAHMGRHRAGLDQAVHQGHVLGRRAGHQNQGLQVRVILGLQGVQALPEGLGGRMDDESRHHAGSGRGGGDGILAVVVGKMRLQLVLQGGAKATRRPR